MFLYVALALCAHGGGYGPCGDSTLALQSALVRAPSSPPWCIQSIMPSSKKARLGRTGKGVKSKLGARDAKALAARDLEADRRASLAPPEPELDEEVVVNVVVDNVVLDEGTREESQRAVRDPVAAQRASLEPPGPELDKEAVEDELKRKRAFAPRRQIGLRRQAERRTTRDCSRRRAAKARQRSAQQRALAPPAGRVPGCGALPAQGGGAATMAGRAAPHVQAINSHLVGQLKKVCRARAKLQARALAKEAQQLLETVGAIVASSPARAGDVAGAAANLKKLVTLIIVAVAARRLVVGGVRISAGPSTGSASRTRRPPGRRRGRPRALYIVYIKKNASQSW
jgi:hypothetical protein